MKRRIAILLLALLLGVTAAQAENSILRQNDKFSLLFTDFTGTEAHAMELKAGGKLEIQTVLLSGALQLTIKHNDGGLLYTGTGVEEPGFKLDIPRDDIYRIAFSAVDADGSTRINVVDYEPEVDPNAPVPFTLDWVQGTQGYSLEYDSDYFTFVPDAVNGDTFQSASDAKVAVTLQRKEGTLDAVVAGLLSGPDAVELDPAIIDWRAARIVRVQRSTAPDSPIAVHATIETGENEVFCFTATYYTAVEESVGARAERMLDSLTFPQ